MLRRLVPTMLALTTLSTACVLAPSGGTEARAIAPASAPTEASSGAAKAPPAGWQGNRYNVLP
jgi:hypothetical protein